MKIFYSFALLALTSLPTFVSPLKLDFSVLANDQSPRLLQEKEGTAGGPVPDLLAPLRTCKGGTSENTCDLFQRVGFEDDYIDLNITVFFPNIPGNGFDFRPLGDRSYCVVRVTPSNTSRVPKDCACNVCPDGFGASSFSIDCSEHIRNGTEAPTSAPTVPNPFGPSEGTATALETDLPDPFIWSTCTSIDCGGNCNGTCSLGCQKLGSAQDLCDFCVATDLVNTTTTTGVAVQGTGTSSSFVPSLKVLATVSAALLSFLVV